MSRKIRWGVVSTARISNQFVDDMAFVENGEIIAVASRSLDPAREFAAAHGIPKAYGDYSEMLADPDIDAAYIATPHTLHLQNSLDALAAGKAVLCEKPLTINPAEARQLAEAAESSNVYLMEAMWTWFLPAIRKALEWVEAGRIGKLVHIRADFAYPMRPYSPDRREYDARLGGGCLLEMGIYPVALAWLFTRSHPNNIQATARFAPNGVEDDVVMTFEYDDLTAALATSYRCRLRNSAHIIGEEGYIVIPDFFRARECTLYELEDPVEHFADGRKGAGFEFETQAVCQDLLAGRKQSEIVQWSDSIAFQDLMAAVKAVIQPN